MMHGGTSYDTGICQHKTAQGPSNRGHKALDQGTLGGCGCLRHGGTVRTKFAGTLARQPQPKQRVPMAQAATRRHARVGFAGLFMCYPAPLRVLARVCPR